jgi:hypothetical protein
MSDEKDIEKKVNLEGFAASLELPEGHQLVLGELPPGTVVEVATWQGTGRPDETTNRFLLSASGSGLQRRERSAQPSTGEVHAPNQREISAPEKSSSQSVGSIGAGASYLGMKTFGVDTPPTAMKQDGFAWKKLGQGFFTVVSIVAITSLVLSLCGISAVVPTRGAKTALGPSTNALVIYKKTPSVSIGNPTVAIGKVKGKDAYIFGPSNTFSKDTFQIETTAGQELVQSKNVVGRAFLAIPLIGVIAKSFLGNAPKTSRK